MKPIQYDRYFWRNELVTLRSPEESDWEIWYHNRFDTPARRFLQAEVELPPSPGESRPKTFAEHCAASASSDGIIFLTIVNNDGEVVGGANLHSIDERNGTFGIGMYVDRDNRGKGYGTAAMRLLMKYAFFERRLNKYHGWVLEGNIPSATMLEKVGCRQEGRRTQMVYTDGRYLDQILYGLTRAEFEANEAAISG